MSLHENFSNEWAWRKRPGIPAGSDVESALFGSPIVPLAERKGEYIPFGQALDFVKKHQPKSFERPRVVRDLRAKVVALCEDTATPVKFFTAVGTPLDTYHGADAFFEQGGRIATVDISLREKETHKADVLLVASIDDEGEVLVSEKEMMHAASKIAEILNKTSTLKAA